MLRLLDISILKRFYQSSVWTPPPLTIKVWPDIHGDIGEAKKRTA